MNKNKVLKMVLVGTVTYLLNEWINDEKSSPKPEIEVKSKGLLNQKKKQLLGLFS